MKTELLAGCASSLPFKNSIILRFKKDVNETEIEGIFYDYYSHESFSQINYKNMLSCSNCSIHQN